MMAFKYFRCQHKLFLFIEVFGEHKPPEPHIPVFHSVCSVHQSCHHGKHKRKLPKSIQFKGDRFCFKVFSVIFPVFTVVCFKCLKKT